MKKLIVFGLLLGLVVSIRAFGQEFRHKTNEFYVDMSTVESEDEKDIPTIAWITPEKTQSTSLETKVIIKLRVNSITDLENIKINVIDSKRGDDVGKKEIVLDSIDTNEEFIEYELYLPPGYNTIEIQAQNASGAISSSRRELIVGQNAVAESMTMLRNDRALFFATDEYDHWGNLVNPVNDATTIAEELEKNYGFETEIVKNPTTDQIMVKLREYASKDYGKYDQLLIFIAGHGQFDESFGIGYVVARNSLKNDPAKTSYISHSNLRDVINNIPSEHIFLAMDVCFGGTFDQKIASERGGMEVYNEISKSDYITRKLEYKTRKFLTSGGKEYVSDGIPGKHSPFARKFLDALRSYGGSDRVITLSELNLYVEKLVPQPRTGEFGDNEPGSDFLFIAE